MKRLLLFGANGQLGSDLLSILSGSYQVIAATHSDCDLADTGKLHQYLEDVRPDIIINTAAYHHVEQCEQHPDLAYRINADAPAEIAAYAYLQGCRFIHFSTDYVFDGNTKVPYTETDPTAPLNIYGKSKLKGEQQIRECNPDAVVIRVSGLYGQHPCRAKNGLNFVQLMLKLAKEKGEVKVVNDEFVSPTYTQNVAEQTAAILENKISGIIHATSDGFCSWYDFAEEIFRYTNTQVKLDFASSNDFPAKVPRPKYSVLENAKLKQAGINKMKDWKTALHLYLDSIRQV